MATNRPSPRPESDESAEPSAEESADSFMREAAAISEPPPSAVAPGAPLEAGDVVADRFRIEGPAGRGGRGAVYRALDTATGKHVAIKVTDRPSGSAGDRFRREAAVLAELSHPAVVRYVAHGATPWGQPFLAMDWLDGEDLADRLSRQPFDTRESLVLARRAAEGLAAAHALGVVHRDVKPSNLFLVGGDAAETKVIDFGVARVEAGAAALTRPGASLGTPRYMSPEQATEATDVDARADVYALGCVLFECLTGRPPFVGRGAPLLVKVLRDPAPRLRELRPETSPELDALVSRLLAKDRAERPRDGLELVRAIDAILG